MKPPGFFKEYLNMARDFIAKEPMTLQVLSAEMRKELGTVQKEISIIMRNSPEQAEEEAGQALSLYFSSSGTIGEGALDSLLEQSLARIEKLIEKFTESNKNLDEGKIKPLRLLKARLGSAKVKDLATILENTISQLEG